ncbi:sulfotransferase family protein [Paraburkholderia acidicola]|uniref:SulN n=1 Tax=Paraburkholderia acidicola TaxID=1912599 RepID=A0A1I9RH14_9BURK|nr:sulfotransferase family 2 domain-containing protein [Paraburkholderia acidicola]AOZ21321.1 SulN [Paraburkholderia acidicola]PCE22685.1 sulfotransferase family protein [Paraburkholderia acidicola]
MTTNDHRIAFVHIPRTAGTTFGVYLDGLYAGRKAAKFYADELHPVVNAKVDAFRELDADEKASFELLRGHFVYGFDDGESGCRYLTLLREPVARLVSYYFYALKERTHYLHTYLFQRRIGLERFLMSDASIDLDNSQVRAISGATFASSRERVTEAHLELAKRNLLERFAAFGLTEQFDVSMQRFSRAFGWPLPAQERRNEGAYARDMTLSDACRAYVEEKNRFDIELYRFATAHFESAAAYSERAADPAIQTIGS